eukprot:3773369-Rhodomonas_salina.4
MASELLGREVVIAGEDDETRCRRDSLDCSDMHALLGHPQPRRELGAKKLALGARRRAQRRVDERLVELEVEHDETLALR